MKKIVAIGLFLGVMLPLCAQESNEKTQVLFVVDASSSMNRPWGSKTKWIVAREALIEAAKNIQMEMGDQVTFGLRVYGHQSLPVYNDCEDTELKLPIGLHSAEMLSKKLNEIKPKGITPLAYTLGKSKDDYRQIGGRNILILLTDGAESCDGDPCTVIQSLLEEGIILKPFVIGLDIPSAAIDEYQCIGTVYNSKTPSTFRTNLQHVLNRTVIATALQVELLDGNGFSTETDVPITFLDVQSGEAIYHFYHRLKQEAVPDTLYVDPLADYVVQVHSIPEVYSDTFRLNPFQHNTIQIPLPRGQLEIQTNTIFSDEEHTYSIPCLVFPPGGDSLLTQQATGTTKKYLSGTYDVGVMSVPFEWHTVVVEPGKKTSLIIDAPGKLILTSPRGIVGEIAEMVDDRLKSIYTFKSNTTSDIVDLQPGSYKLILRYYSDNHMIKTFTKEVVIQSNQITEIKLTE